MTNKITIISLGWLGLSLYTALKKKSQIYVSGCYHSQKKEVENQYHFDINSYNELPNQIKDSDIIFLNLPPSKVHSKKEFKDFLSLVKSKKLIFISSTSVYGQEGLLHEDDPPSPKSDNGKLLLDVEGYIQENFKSYTIIRPGGLYGTNRHPSRYLSGKEREISFHDVVNLISDNDLISIIEKVISDKENKIINAINKSHPPKHEYYRTMAIKMGLAPPQFNDNNKKTTRIIKTKHKEFEISSDLYEVI